MTTVTKKRDHREHASQPTPAHPQHQAPSYDDVNTPVVLLVGLISAIVTFLTIAFVQGLFYQWQNSYVRERTYDFVNEPVKQIIDHQKALLAGSETTISIDEAMKKVISEYQKSAAEESNAEQPANSGEHESQ
jgi:hypothetical protein